MEAQKSPLPACMETAAAAIADRCAKDPAWMEKFKADPHQALQEMTGRELPADLQIHLHQNDDDNWHVPVKKQAADAVKDSEMAQLSGGEVVGVIIAVSVATAATAGAAAAAGAAVGGGVVGGMIAADKKKSGKK